MGIRTPLPTGQRTKRIFPLPGAPPAAKRASPTSTLFARFGAVGRDKLSVFNTGIANFKNSDEWIGSKKSIRSLFLA
jgi:hypothetical protein